MPAIVRPLLFAAALALAACGPTPESATNNAAADDGLPVTPGVYGNVAAGKGMELQVHKLPRKLIEVTFCDGACQPIRRVPYEIVGEAMRFAFTRDGETLAVSITQQGEGLKADGTGIGAEPVTLQRIPKRDALTKAEEALRAGTAQ